ncbi:MAG: LPS export ABC transporter permease LptG [Endozoicomonadaceae bacterium]|nr:LPS export ABC transporter permease LptG [Endozoicomonadaceae bacterium]
MKKLDRYIGLNVLGAMLIVLVVLVFLNNLFVFLDQLDSIRAHYQLPQILKYMILITPKRIYDAIPIAALIGCLVSLGSMAGHSELVVMRAAGVSLSRIGWAVIKPALLMIVGGMLIGEYLMPVSEQKAVTQRKIERSTDGRYSDEGIWHREGNSFMFFNAVQPPGVLYGVSRFTFDDKQRLVESSYADRATYQGDHWLLQDVKNSHYQGDKVTTTRSPTEDWHAKLTTMLLKVIVVKPDDLSIEGLMTYIGYLREQGLKSGEYVLALWKKILQPLSIFALVMIGMSFIFGPLRSVSMGLRLFAGVMTGVMFMMLQNLMGPASLVYGFSPIVAALLPIAICFGIGVILLRRVA